MKRFLLHLIILSSSTILAQIPSGYYNSADGLSGQALKAALHNIIKNHHTLSYDSVKIALRVTDQDTIDASKVICFYTGWTYGKYDFGNGSEEWNREHVWSKSHGDFGNSPPEGTDLHQLRPTDASVNSAKSNRDFSWGITQYIDGSGPTDCYKDTDIWEPRDEVKGDVARIIFYMATRYEGDNGEEDLEPVDTVNTAPNYEPYYGKLSVLLNWHSSDPVDNWERRRNDTVYYKYQHNRNPFIDHPEWVDSIWGNSIAGEPSNHVDNFMAASSTASSITLTWDNNDGAVPAQNYLVQINLTGNFTAPSDSVSYPNDTDLSDGEGAYNVSHSAQTYTWENLSSGTQYYFIIYPYTNSGENINYKTDGTVPTTNDATGNTGDSAFIIISEVADPSDNYKARYVEITNIGTADMDFDSETWFLSRQANGNSWVDIALSGFLKADSSMVVAYNATSFNSAYGSNPNIINGGITGNGDDGYFLYSGGNHTTGTMVDAYGVINQDGSGKAWEYTDSRAFRIYSVAKADSIWHEDEWVIESASTVKMTPNWHIKVLTWTGIISSNVDDKNNWNENTGNKAKYPPDASCKQIFMGGGNYCPIISSNKTWSTVEIESGCIVTVQTGVVLKIVGK